MKKKNVFYYLFSLAFVLVLTSCGKDEPDPPVITGEALFSYEVDGYDVTFTNLSTVSGTTTNAWDFGDGETSTDKNPVHTFATKGEYTVKLVVTDENNGTHDVSTKVKVDKSTPVKLDDNSFDDWSSVSEAFTIGDNAGSIKSFKIDFDSDNIYFYIKQDNPYPTASIFDMLIDVDPDQTTGYTYGLWPNFGGAELLIENSFSNDRENEDHYWLDFAPFNPEGTDWDTQWIYDEGNTSEAQIDGTYKELNTIVEMEWSLSRTKIPALKDKEVLKIVAWTSNQDWDEIGWMPEKATTEVPDADGITIDMR